MDGSGRISYIPLAGPLSVFVLGGVLGLLASYDLMLSMPWLLWLSAGTALYIAIMLFARSADRLRWAAGVPVLIATISAVYLATQYRYLGFEAKFGIVTWLGRLTSGSFPALGLHTMSANAAATFLEGTLPLGIGLAITSRRGWRGCWSLCAATIAYGILLTASRGAWTALTVAGGLGCLAWARSAIRRRVIRGWLIGVLTVAGCSAIIALLIVTPMWRQALDSAEYRATDRFTLYRNSFFLALDFPFSGIGPGTTFGLIYSQFQLLIPSVYLTYTHNLFLAIWLAQGLLGLLGFGALLLGSGRLVWRGLVRTSPGAPSAIGWGATLGCTAFLLHGLTDAPQYGGTELVLLMSFALFGLMIAAAWLADSRPLAWIQLGRKGTIVATLALLAALAVIGRPLLAGASANISAICEAQSQLQPNIDDDKRVALHHMALAWADRGLQFEAQDRAALKARGMLAFTLADRDFDMAILLLEPALRRAPADQSIRKALGYAYIWNGRIAQGVQLLKSIDRAGEIQQELQIWPIAWQDRGRPDLAAQAQRAATAISTPGQ